MSMDPVLGPLMAAAGACLFLAHLCAALCALAALALCLALPAAALALFARHRILGKR